MRFFDEEGKETFIIEPLKNEQGGYQILFDTASLQTVQSLTEAFKVYEDAVKLRKQTWLNLRRTV